MMNSALIQFTRTKHLILRSDLRHAIQTLALNHLHYCTQVWSTAGMSSTAPIRRSLRMAERLACSQLNDLNLLLREKIKVLRSRITQERSSHHINNCLLFKIYPWSHFFGRPCSKPAASNAWWCRIRFHQWLQSGLSLSRSPQIRYSPAAGSLYISLYDVNRKLSCFCCFRDLFEISLNLQCTYAVSH